MQTGDNNDRRSEKMNDTTNDNYAAPSRTFTEAIEVCFAKYINFKGRASRTEFWWFFLFFYLLQHLVAIAGTFTSGSFAANWDFFETDESIEMFVLYAVFLLPNLAVGARRLHDIGISGWWQLLLATGFGILLLVYWWTRPNDSAKNRYDIER